MPNNIVCVNHVLSFKVNDSRMSKLMEWLRLKSWLIGDLAKLEEKTTEICRSPEKSSNR